MILAGLIRATVASRAVWAFFAFSIFCFIPITIFVCGLLGKCVDCCYDYSLFFWNLKQVVFVFGFAWFFYPWVWIAGTGTGRMSVNTEAILYLVLDLIAKVVVGWIIICMRPICNLCDFNCHEEYCEKVEKSLCHAGFKCEKYDKEY